MSKGQLLNIEACTEEWGCSRTVRAGLLLVPGGLVLLPGGLPGVLLWRLLCSLLGELPGVLLCWPLCSLFGRGLLGELLAELPERACSAF